MKKNTDVLQQLEQWGDELQQVRNDYAIGIKPGGDLDFDRILKQMKAFIASKKEV